MLLQLNVLPNGVCAQIYAIAEVEEEGFRGTKTLKIWHNRDLPSLHLGRSLPTNYDNDQTVSFKSKVPFIVFCQQFEASEFNNPLKYHLFKHNCSNAANYALELARIKLPLRQFFFIPLLPDHLYRKAKTYKIEELRKKPFSLDFKLELASKRLLFWKQKAGAPSKIKKVETILSETAKYKQSREHHAEAYLKGLIDTIDLLIYSKNTSDLREYRDFSEFFKTREPSRSAQLLKQQRIWASLSVALILIILLTGLDLWALVCGANIPAGILLWKYIKAANQEGFAYIPSIKKATELSQAMHELSIDVAQQWQESPSGMILTT